MNTNKLQRIINEEVDSAVDNVLNESKMRSMNRYWTPIIKTAIEIWNKRFEIIKKGEEVFYIDDFDFKIPIHVYNEKQYLSLYPDMKGSNGFCRNHEFIAMYIDKFMNKRWIVNVLFHEIEHFLDAYGVYTGESSKDINSYYLSNLYNKNKENRKFIIHKWIEEAVEEILYRFWDNSERNAFMSSILLGIEADKLDDYIDRYMKIVDNIEKTPLKGDEEFWMGMKTIITNSKSFKAKIKDNPDLEDEIKPENVKRHFIRQSRLNIESFRKSAVKKIGGSLAAGHDAGGYLMDKYAAGSTVFLYNDYEVKYIKDGKKYYTTVNGLKILDLIKNGKVNPKDIIIFNKNSGEWKDFGDTLLYKRLKNYSPELFYGKMRRPVKW